MRVFAVLSLILLLSACSETPTETKTKEPEKPSTPITAQQAFRYTYPASRAWAADSLPLRIRSMQLTGVPAEPGKAGAWEIIYVSQVQQEAKIYTWAAIEASETLHKDVFAGKAQAWSPSGQEKPFEASAFHIDTPAAVETAKTNSKAYLDKPGAKPPINFWLEFTPRFAEPVLRVMWGETAGSAEYTAIVGASSGQMLGKI